MDMRNTRWEAGKDDVWVMISIHPPDGNAGAARGQLGIAKMWRNFWHEVQLPISQLKQDQMHGGDSDIERISHPVFSFVCEK
jgi:hypothetical protein